MRVSGTVHIDTCLGASERVCPTLEILLVGEQALEEDDDLAPGAIADHRFAGRPQHRIRFTAPPHSASYAD
jgi:hypothetical protein